MKRLWLVVLAVAGLPRQQAYLKAFNTEVDDSFGGGTALSGDGHTLAVGASNEDSRATGVNGNPADESSEEAAAVYIFGR
ncbi:hypothetical protein HPC49_08490 [Pyxidicoccus fallax]|uniref:Uncharacterized protein n=1 Tax=Pyxidicoccus fallax TaxID=394095 RepID=A0A848L409_9BACT|nr:hypothetical protein [Pyxidicoccus fallax]NMO13369.1 hypothetical protein [Pyxidicoccus fallax]NPC78287.1 hypothetical protein [Pyxidicoccus fallax]